MSSFKDLTRSVSYKYNDKINKYCSSLFNYFNLFQFFYYEIKNDGRFSTFHSSQSWSEYYDANQFYLIDPYYRHPKYFKEGIILIRDTQNHSVEPILNPGKDKFHVGFILKLVKKTHDGVEVFGFTSPTPDDSHVSFLISEMPLLRTFIEKFKADHPLLLTALKDNQLNLANLIGPTFNEPTLILPPDFKKKQALLQNLGMSTEAPLSPIEISVMKLFVKGYSAGKIAPQIYLSRRTVEHHMERIKRKLDCSSKTELIQKARELEQFGLLNV